MIMMIQRKDMERLGSGQSHDTQEANRGFVTQKQRNCVGAWV